jgi:nitroimidazol reductase NimA-like FMN-containing flavoprotein (pyridoxamine 5'-phosphate oxidase superfamily)
MSPSDRPAAGPPSERSRVRRLAERGSYDPASAYAILDEGLVCHVGLSTPDGPVVIPTLYARDGDRLLLHGSVASRLLRSASSEGAQICVTVTLIDGLVLARSAFHHSMNYRSVVVFGQAQRIDDLDEKRAAMDVLVEALVPGRSADARAPSEVELRQTAVLALPLHELSVKVRDGGVKDEEEDLDLPVWAGVLPLPIVPGAPVPDPLQAGDALPVPDYVLSYRRPHPRPR